MSLSEQCRLNSLVLALACAAVCDAQAQTPAPQTVQLRVIEVNEPDGQILSYRHLAGSTDIRMRGTRLAPKAEIKLKIGSRPGFVELDINRGGITGLEPAHRLGKDFLTYVLWAVSVDGKASNLGEITFDGDRPVPVNLTTPYQTFWLMVTAEPNYAVVDPSAQVVLYSVKQASSGENDALPIEGDLFFFTHYAAYETTPGGALDAIPNQLLQARKAVELASKSGLLAAEAAGKRLEQGRGVHARSAQAGRDVSRPLRSRLQEESERSGRRSVRAHLGTERRKRPRSRNGRGRRPCRAAAGARAGAGAPRTGRFRPKTTHIDAGLPDADSRERRRARAERCACRRHSVRCSAPGQTAGAVVCRHRVGGRHRAAFSPAVDLAARAARERHGTPARDTPISCQPAGARWCAGARGLGGPAGRRNSKRRGAVRGLFLFWRTRGQRAVELVLRPIAIALQRRRRLS